MPARRSLKKTIRAASVKPVPFTVTVTAAPFEVNEAGVTEVIVNGSATAFQIGSITRSRSTGSVWVAAAVRAGHPVHPVRKYPGRGVAVNVTGAPSA